MNFSITGDTITLNVYDEIGAVQGESEAFKTFVDANKEQAKKLICNVNSEGGSYAEGMGIYNTIKSFTGETTANISGVAASMATIIALACQKVTIAKGGFFLIHNSATIAAGDKNEMQKAVNTLKATADSMAAIYAERTKIAVAEIMAWMDAETIFTAEEAKEKGFVTEIIDTGKTSAFSTIFGKLKSRVYDSAIKTKELTDTLTAKEALLTDMTGKLDKLSVEHIKVSTEKKDIEAKLTAKTEEAVKLNDTIKNLQSSRDKAVTEANDFRAKLDRLTLPGFKFEPENSVSTWSEAQEEFKDLPPADAYVQARKKYPTIYAQFMNSQKK